MQRFLTQLAQRGMPTSTLIIQDTAKLFCEGLSKHSQVVMIIARATMKKNEQRTLARFIPS